MEAKVWRNRIDILGAVLPKNEILQALLDELKAEHVPAFPTGKRMSVVVAPNGRIDALIFRTTAMPDKKVIRILEKYGIPATSVAESRDSRSS
jgi:hypothetical protein